MINFIYVYIAFELFTYIYNHFIHQAIDKQRALPLPDEVKDVYDPERYQTFLCYKQEYRKHNFKFKIIVTIINLIIIFIGAYKWIDTISHGNEYLVTLYSCILSSITMSITDYISSYIETFTIEEKYGQNKKTKKEFNKDFFLNEIPMFFIGVLLYFLIIYIIHFVSKLYTSPISFLKAFFITACITAVLWLAIQVVSSIAILIMKKTYTFTEMEDNDLRKKIVGLLKGVKKKIYHIYVYDESKKSISKNAFVLHFLFYREISIADNFITENKEDELLAVISHEVGHLKHKKDILDFIRYIFLFCNMLLVAYFIHDPTLLVSFTNWINTSFGITTTNITLVLTAIMTFYSPISFLTSLFAKYKSRRDEYEADRNAVKEGYGEALIRTFKQMSNDELIDVNPCKWIEVTEYDHPGMTNRIRAILKEEAKISK